MTKEKIASSDTKKRGFLKGFFRDLSQNPIGFSKAYNKKLQEHSLVGGLNRYIQPFKFIAMATYYAVYMSLAISFVLVTLSQAVILRPWQFIISKLLSLIIPNQVKMEIFNWNRANPGEVIDGLTELRLVAIGLFKSIFKPLSEVKGSKFWSVLTRPIQLIAAPFILSAVFLSRLIGYVSFALTVIVGAVVSAIYFANLAVLNTPLFVLDFSKYCSKKIKGLFNRNSKSTVEVANGEVSTSAATLSHLTTSIPANEQTAPVVTEEQAALAVTEEQAALAVTQEQAALAVTQEQAAPVVTQEQAAPVVTQEQAAPVDTAEQEVPVFQP